MRAGVHTGEVQLRGDSVAGIAVHTGARTAALAGPGEILVSRTVTDLTAESGLAFEPRGEHELKGLPGPWQVCTRSPRSEFVAHRRSENDVPRSLYRATNRPCSITIGRGPERRRRCSGSFVASTTRTTFSSSSNFASVDDANEARQRLVESGVLDRFEDKHGPNVVAVAAD